MTSNSSGVAVTIIIPAYNEEANIARLVEQILGEPWNDHLILGRLIIVDDCSIDGTKSIAEQLAREHECIDVIRHAQRWGKNASIRDGLAACTSQIVAILDADISLKRGCLSKTVELLRENESLAATSCVNEPLPARTWAERASRFQALLLTEASRLGHGSLLRVYALKMAAIRGLVLPDTTHDDLYIPRWLRNHGFRYAVHPHAVVYMRSAAGLRDFAKQTLRAWQAIQALDQVLPHTRRDDYAQGVTARAVIRAIRREPIGFILYVLWRCIVMVTPARWWLPFVDHSRHNTSRSTKNLQL